MFLIKSWNTFEHHYDNTVNYDYKKGNIEDFARPGVRSVDNLMEFSLPVLFSIRSFQFTSSIQLF